MPPARTRCAHPRDVLLLAGVHGRPRLTRRPRRGPVRDGIDRRGLLLRPQRGDLEVVVRRPRGRPRMGPVPTVQLGRGLDLPAQPAVASVNDQHRSVGRHDQRRTVVEQAVAPRQDLGYVPGRPGERGRVLEPDSAQHEHDVVAPDDLLAMSEGEPDAARAVGGQPREAVHRPQGLGGVGERVGRVEEATAVEATHPHSTGAVEGRAAPVDQVVGVLAPLRGPLLVGDPDPPAGVDRQAWPHLEPVGRRDGHRPARRTVGREAPQDDVVVARLVRIVGDVHPSGCIDQNRRRPFIGRRGLRFTARSGASSRAAKTSAWPSTQPCHAIQTGPPGAAARTTPESVPAVFVSRVIADQDCARGS